MASGGAECMFFVFLQLRCFVKRTIFAGKHITVMSRFTVALAVLLLSLPVFPQKHVERGYRTIQPADARVIVEMLASDSLQGRDAGGDGGRMAAEYIVSLLDEWGYSYC